jgi:hypothetical protein
MRVREKVVLSTEGQPTRVKRQYDQAHTPLDRLCETDAISQEQKDELLSLRDQANPRNLRQAIYDQIDCIFGLPGAKPGVTEDVYKILSQPIQIPKGEGASVTLSFGLIASSR